MTIRRAAITCLFDNKSPPLEKRGARAPAETSELTVIGFSALVCPGCGAPLPPEALLSVVTCSYCGASVTCDETSVGAAGFLRALADRDADVAGEPRTWIGGVPYRVLAKIAAGAHADVLLAERARRITELVVIKKARGDGERLRRAWAVLGRVQHSEARGAAHFSRRLPQPVAFGIAKSDDDGERPALVWRYASGFVHTLDDVRREHPTGVDSRHGVWMWRRLLELLGFVHASGFVHGAVSPEHVLIHARDHGAMLVGWSDARALDSPAEDIVASARCVVGVLGGDPSRGTVPASVPAPIADLLGTYAASSRVREDAWTLRRIVGEAARAAYGGPAYHRLSMPGWR